MKNGILPLQAIGIARSFAQEGRKIEVLREIDLSVSQGEIVGITGASGTGKSTLLHVLGGLDKPDRGDVLIDGDSIAGLKDEKISAVRAEKIGFIFQFHHLLPEFTALENALLPAMIAGRNGAAARAKAESLFATVGLSDRLSHRPGKLSGGEQQRTALVRALMNDPLVLLADEPTGNLDEHTAEEVFGLMRRIAAENSVATVVVTHNLKLAEKMDTVYQLHEGILEKRTN